MDTPCGAVEVKEWVLKAVSGGCGLRGCVDARPLARAVDMACGTEIGVHHVAVCIED